jgi:exopolyphosphatase/guanosine-5'-triphosphate,3'-diphosphate pyrophosphatase
VISGEDEASLTFEGALSGLSVRGDVLVFDIGGGSTEVISGQARATARIDSLASLDIGSVRLTERHVTSDPLNSADIVAVRRSAREAFATLPVPPPTATLIGVGGTVTTLYAASIGLATYDSKCVHGATLTELTLAELTSRLTTLTASERCEIKGIEPGRADVMPAGAILTSEALRWGHGAEMVVSDRGLRWGLLERLLAP